MTRRATPEQLRAARGIAIVAMEFGVNTVNWRQLIDHLATYEEVEIFRITLLLKGKDTRSARHAIADQKAAIWSAANVRRGKRGPDRKQRKPRGRKGDDNGRD